MRSFRTIALARSRNIPPPPSQEAPMRRPLRPPPFLRQPRAAAAGASAPLGMVEGECFGFARARWFGRIASDARRGMVRATAHLEQQLLVTIDHHLLGES